MIRPVKSACLNDCLRFCPKKAVFRSHLFVVDELRIATLTNNQTCRARRAPQVSILHLAVIRNFFRSYRDFSGGTFPKMGDILEPWLKKRVTITRFPYSRTNCCPPLPPKTRAAVLGFKITDTILENGRNSFKTANRHPM